MEAGVYSSSSSRSTWNANKVGCSLLLQLNEVHVEPGKLYIRFLLTSFNRRQESYPNPNPGNVCQFAVCRTVTANDSPWMCGIWITPGSAKYTTTNVYMYVYAVPWTARNSKTSDFTAFLRGKSVDLSAIRLHTKYKIDVDWVALNGAPPDDLQVHIGSRTWWQCEWRHNVSAQTLTDVYVLR